MLTQAHYDELWALHRGRPFANSPVAQALMHNLSLLQYNGGDAWWDIDPIVRPLLEERAAALKKAGASPRGAAGD